MKDNSIQPLAFRFKLAVFVFSFFLYAITYTLFPKEAIAQAIGLSVSPPLFELTVKPGKEVKELFTLTNLGGDAIVTAKIVYFIPSGNFGEIETTENPAPEWIIYNKEAFYLKSREKNDFQVIFSPPAEAAEGDHFLTLLFETAQPVDLLGQSSSSYSSRIGTNILLTISKDGNPQKSAEIINFSAPRIVDSFLSSIGYSLILANNGSSFWKANGKIIVGDETLNLAPQNILSGHSRNVSCLDNQNLIECKLKNKFRLGKITSKLEFSIDDEPKIYQKEIVTYALPFSLSMMTFIVIFLSLKMIKNRK